LKDKKTMKTRKQLLEELHDSVRYEILQREVAIKLHEGEPDSQVIDGFMQKSPLGMERPITKKDLVERYTKEIAERQKTLTAIEELLKQEGGESV